MDDEKLRHRVRSSHYLIKNAMVFILALLANPDFNIVALGVHLCA